MSGPAGTHSACVADRRGHRISRPRRWSSAMASEALVAEVGHEEQSPTSRLRSRGYVAVVVLAIIAATILAFLAKNVPYFPFDVPVTKSIQSLEIPGLEAFFQGVAWV